MKKVHYGKKTNKLMKARIIRDGIIGPRRVGKGSLISGVNGEKLAKENWKLARSGVKY